MDESAPLPRGTPTLLVVSQPFDLSDEPHDGFVMRHRHQITMLGEHFNLVVLFLRPERESDHKLSIPNAEYAGTLDLPRPKPSRFSIASDAIRTALGIDNSTERAIRREIQRVDPDVVIAIGPWIDVEYRAAYQGWPTIFFLGNCSGPVTVASTTSAINARTVGNSDPRFLL